MSFSIEALLGLKKSLSKKEEGKTEISHKCFSWRAMEFSKDGKSNKNDETSILSSREFIQRKRSYERLTNNHEKSKGTIFVIKLFRYYLRKF